MLFYSIVTSIHVFYHLVAYQYTDTDVITSPLKQRKKHLSWRIISWTWALLYDGRTWTWPLCWHLCGAKCVFKDKTLTSSLSVCLEVEEVALRPMVDLLIMSACLACCFVSSGVVLRRDWPRIHKKRDVSSAEISESRWTKQVFRRDPWGVYRKETSVYRFYVSLRPQWNQKTWSIIINKVNKLSACRRQEVCAVSWCGLIYLVKWRTCCWCGAFGYKSSVRPLFVEYWKHKGWE